MFDSQLFEYFKNQVINDNSYSFYVKVALKRVKYEFRFVSQNFEIVSKPGLQVCSVFWTLPYIIGTMANIDAPQVWLIIQSHQVASPRD